MFRRGGVDTLKHTQGDFAPASSSQLWRIERALAHGLPSSREEAWGLCHMVIACWGKTKRWSHRLSSCSSTAQQCNLLGRKFGHVQFTSVMPCSTLYTPPHSTLTHTHTFVVAVVVAVGVSLVCPCRPRTSSLQLVASRTCCLSLVLS